MYYGGKHWYVMRENYCEDKKVSKKQRIIIGIKNFYKKMKMNIFHPNGWNQAPKYDVSICAIFKDEGPYLREWVEYHIGTGIDHIYMYNNNSSDNYLDILKPYIEFGKIELIDWPYDHAQLEAYKDCLKRCKNETRWIGFIDLDEFVVVKNGDKLYNFLKKFEKNRSAVLINWKMFGSNGLVERDMSVPVTEAFRTCNPAPHVNGKCFFNNLYDAITESKKWGGFHHRTHGSYKGKEFSPVNCFDFITERSPNVTNSLDFPVVLHHYCIKSLQEYETKMKKTDVFFKKNPHNMDYFNYYDSNCTEYNESIHFTFGKVLPEKEE